MTHDMMKTLVSGGMVTITLATLYVLFKIMTNDFAHVEAVIQKNNDALLQTAVAQVQMASSVNRLTELIDKKLK